jgi:rubrerythrin
VIGDIRDEEKAHVGELMTLLYALDPKEAEFFASGKAEVQEMLEELGIPAPEAAAAQGENAGIATVGSLLGK